MKEKNWTFPENLNWENHPQQNHTKEKSIENGSGRRNMILDGRSEMHEGMKSFGKGKYMDNSKTILTM